MKAFYLIFVVLTAVQAAIHLRTTTESHSAGSNFYDVIVIGSGIGGTAAASTLAKAGKSVLIL
jgi:heterodisulfide reductase subunit A-like polyferredoxin